MSSSRYGEVLYAAKMVGAFCMMMVDAKPFFSLVNYGQAKSFLKFHSLNEVLKIDH